MSTKRPGVAGAVELSKSLDISLWERVEKQWMDIASKDTLRLEDKANQLGEELKNGRSFLTKKELLEIIVPWKFSVGKARPALWKLLKSNSKEAVEQYTKAGLSMAREIPATEWSTSISAIKSALQCLTNLQGVGPATASVILSLVRPDVFCYMYDECIDCFLPKRTYTMPVYLQCQSACQSIASTLGWNCARVARTLWTAARVRAAGNSASTRNLVDHTLAFTKSESSFQETTAEKRRHHRPQSTDSSRTISKRKRVA